MRAIAALSVLGFHVWLYDAGRSPGPRTALSDRLLFELNLGLICFFVLSGFLLYRGFARAALSGSAPIDLKSYALRRAARIMPAYYACLVGCLALYLAVGLTRLLPPADHLALFAVFGQNYSLDTLMKINPVTWTLSVEAAFYLLLPLLGAIAYRFGRGRAAHQTMLLLGLVATTVAWDALVRTRGWDPIGSKVLPAFIAIFAFGMLAAVFVERRNLRGGTSAALGAPASAALMALGIGLVFVEGYWTETAPAFSGARDLFAHMPAALGFALVITAAAAGRGPAVSWLRLRPLAGIGLISYGIYLWHLPLILVVRQVGLMPDQFVLRLAVVLGASLTAAYASWKLIEQPLIRRAALARSGSRPVRSRPAQAELAARAEA